MATIVTRAGKGSTLTTVEMDANLTNLNNDKLESSAYTASDVLTKIKTVDGSGSGLDADTLRGTTPSTAGLALLDDADASAQRTTLGLGTMAVEAAADYAKKTADADIAMTNYKITTIKTATFNGEYDNGSKSTSFTIDLTNGQKQKATFTSSGALTVTVSNLSVGNYLLKFVNAGLRTITFSPAMKWAGGTAPTLTSSGTDLIAIYTDGTNLYGSALTDVK